MIDAEPVVALGPLHPPEATQFSASDTLHARVAEPPVMTRRGFGARLMIGFATVPTPMLELSDEPNPL